MIKLLNELENHENFLRRSMEQVRFGEFYSRVEYSETANHHNVVDDDDKKAPLALH